MKTNVQLRERVPLRYTAVVPMTCNEMTGGVTVKGGEGSSRWGAERGKYACFGSPFDYPILTVLCYASRVPRNQSLSYCNFNNDDLVGPP